MRAAVLNLKMSTVHLPADKDEDALPRCVTIGDKKVFLVADGHGGKGCTRVINAHADDILAKAAYSGPQTAIQHCIKLCETEGAGAMIIVGVVHENTLTCCSLGDVSCWVYDENSACVFQQPHHDKSFYDAYTGHEKDTMSIGQPARTVFPNANGTCEPGWGYYFYPQACAAAASLGHYGKQCLPPISSTFHLPEQWNIIACTDGIADVVHPFEAASLDIQQIGALAQDRWLLGVVPPEGPRQVIGNDDISGIKIHWN